MGLTIRDPELFGVTESSVTLSFVVTDGAGPVDAPAAVRLNGEVRAQSEGMPGTRLVRVEGLEPETRYEITLELPDGTRAEPDRFFPGVVETLAAPAAEPVASFATLNDLHFGELRFGGTLLADGDYGPEAPGFPCLRADETEVPYWRFMNEDAIAEVNQAGVDCVVIKGDIADRGRVEQFEAAGRAFARFEAPIHAFLGNHDHYALHEGERVDGHALLGQPPAPRSFELGGWRLVLLDSVLPGEHHGVLPRERLAWLADVLEETRERSQSTLLFMHHQPVPPQHRDRFPNTIGLEPEHSLRLFDLVGGHPQVRGVLIGHTHRNRVRRHRAAGPLPFAEVACTKDYPGVWAHYRLFADGSFRQEVRRTGSTRALTHSTRRRDFFNGMYRFFALGPLEARSFATPLDNR